MKIEEYAMPKALFIAEHAKLTMDEMIANDLLSPYSELFRECDYKKQHLTLALSLGRTDDERDLHDLMVMWQKYAGVTFQSLAITAPICCNPGDYYYYVDRSPEYTLVCQIEKFQKLYGRDAAGADLTPGMQLIQDAFDSGIESAIDANLKHGISVADLCAGRD